MLISLCGYCKLDRWSDVSLLNSIIIQLQVANKKTNVFVYVHNGNRRIIIININITPWNRVQVSSVTIIMMIIIVMMETRTTFAYHGTIHADKPTTKMTSNQVNEWPSHVCQIFRLWWTCWRPKFDQFTICEMHANSTCICCCLCWRRSSSLLYFVA